VAGSGQRDQAAASVGARDDWVVVGGIVLGGGGATHREIARPALRPPKYRHDRIVRPLLPVRTHARRRRRATTRRSPARDGPDPEPDRLVLPLARTAA
jgi:hypothetical protein